MRVINVGEGFRIVEREGSKIRGRLVTIEWKAEDAAGAESWRTDPTYSDSAIIALAEHILKNQPR